MNFKKTLKLFFSIIRGNTIVISKIDDKKFDLVLGRAINKDYAKKLLVTSLKTLGRE